MFIARYKSNYVNIRLKRSILLRISATNCYLCEKMPLPPFPHDFRNQQLTKLLLMSLNSNEISVYSRLASDRPPCFIITIIFFSVMTLHSMQTLDWNDWFSVVLATGMTHVYMTRSTNKCARVDIVHVWIYSYFWLQAGNATWAFCQQKAKQMLIY